MGIRADGNLLVLFLPYLTFLLLFIFFSHSNLLALFFRFFIPLIFSWDIYFFHLVLLKQHHSIIFLWQLYFLINLMKKGRPGRGRRGRDGSERRLMCLLGAF